jgi:Cu/Ag efflux protein CusF
MQKRPLSLSLSLVAGLAVGAAGLVQPVVAESTTVTPIAGEATVTELTGTVVVVNTETRKMTIKTPEGRFELIDIPEQVSRINEIKIGDKVAISETEAVLVDLEQGRDAGAMGAIGDTKVQRDPGVKPGGSITETLKLYGKVEAVDRANSRVTIRGPQKVVTLKVKDQAILAKLKPGDGVIANYMRVLTGKIIK